MVALVDHNFLILNRTPYILLHIWIPHKILIITLSKPFLILQ